MDVKGSKFAASLNVEEAVGGGRLSLQKKIIKLYALKIHGKSHTSLHD